MAGKSGRSINNVPKSPDETDDLQLGRHSGTPVYCSKYFLCKLFRVL